MTEPRPSHYRPAIFDPAIRDESAEITRLRQDPTVRVVDTLQAQLAELVKSRAPGARLTSSEVAERTRALCGAREPACFGRWVHYPWSNTLVHVLPPEEFHELRTDRNRHKISAAEQHILRAKNIGVVGLSVGHSIALTLVLEGVGGRFRLADPDTLDLSNLNRLRTRLGDLGQNKSVIAARHIAEVDPYLEVEILSEGLTPDNCEQFVLGDGVPLDLIIEECDDLEMKLLLREQAKRHGTPVIMETSDRGMLDIERFDFDPEMPLLHGLLEGFDLSGLGDAAPADKIPMALSVLGVQRMSVRARASLVEIGQSVSTWPQLASSIMLGSALVTNAARRILLGSLEASGRFRVDLDDLVQEHRAEVVGEGNTFSVRPSPESLLEPRPLPRPRVPGAGTGREHVDYILQHAILAPSGGNAQPWRFDVRGTQIDCCMATPSDATFLDVEGLASIVAMGAAIENMVLAARELGMTADVKPFPDDKRADLIATVRVRPGISEGPSPLFPYVVERVSNRRRGERAPVPPEVIHRFRTEAARRNASVHVLDNATDLTRLGTIIGTCDRLRLFSDRMRKELLNELRWTPEEAASTRDGLELASLELSALDHAALSILSSDDVISVLREIDGANALVTGATEHMAGASAAVLISHPTSDRSGFLAGGRALQAVWLCATESGFAVHPQGVAGYLFERISRGGLDREQMASLTQLRRTHDALFGLPPNAARIMILRLCSAMAPSARSLRKPLHTFVRRYDG